MAKQSLIQGTIILTIAALITKILGFTNGIVMANVIGPEGVGLIMMAMPVTGLLITFTTIGLPVAISKLVAEAEVKKDHQRVKKILIVSLTTTSIIGFILMVGAFMGARVLSSIFLADQRAYYSLIAVIPIVPIIAISSVIKGYFRGKQNMTPIALSQIIEQVVRIGFILILVHWLLPYGIEYAAAGAVLSGIIGEGFSLLYLLSIFKWSKRKQFKLRNSFIKQISKGKGIFYDLLQTGLPTTGNGLIHSIIGVFQPIIITQSLALAGIGTALATKQYGIIMGFTLPLLMLPGFITNSMSVPLIPAISEANEKSDLSLIHKRTRQAIRIALIVGVPSTIILYLFAEMLTTVIYKSLEAATLLKIMAPFYLLQYFRIPLQSIIIGLGKAKIVMINDLIATIFKLVLIFVLASSPDFGIHGVALAICAGIVLGTSLNFFTISKLIGFSPNLIEFIKVILSGVVMGCCGLLAFNYFNGEIQSRILLLIISLMISLSIYLLFLITFKVIYFRKQ
ncbi:stage V sporulation protein B [Rossellomorea sp. BNER]|uniref:stage V sporulation protein B n=1 Tax=Rossellomorea sp. BNER TaxID=2962031 RepID=UPI003AF30244|nr:stage V sporulation protein B [Rossellomorea sp. BNER]